MTDIGILSEEQTSHEHAQFLRFAPLWETLSDKAKEWLRTRAEAHPEWLGELPEPQPSQLTAMLRGTSR
jgi:hypothetical protein